MNNDLIPQKSLTRREQLEQEIESIQARIKQAEETEARARNDQHWEKKRLKIAKDELNELQA